MKVNQLKLGVSEISGAIYLGIPKNSDELKDPVNFSEEFFKTLIIYCSNKNHLCMRVINTIFNYR